ncbi:DUF6289 family protein [Longispora sp. NPDC051575]|uniref:DUF6289 family protein n=1 Tax=Longispora sp. NPDC051575 TaxID=3154943 RepID=UPI00343C7B4A
MIRRAMLVSALVVAGLTATALPAQAFPEGPFMVVYAYFSDAAKTQLIGQTWNAGCGSAGSWGSTAGYRTVYFTAC